MDIVYRPLLSPLPVTSNTIVFCPVSWVAQCGVGKNENLSKVLIGILPTVIILVRKRLSNKDLKMRVNLKVSQYLVFNIAGCISSH